MKRKFYNSLAVVVVFSMLTLLSCEREEIDNQEAGQELKLDT